MNFKKLAHEIVDEVAGKSIELPVDLNESFLELNIEPDKKRLIEDVDLVLSGLDSDNSQKEFKKNVETVKENLKTGFIGSFKEAPNPFEYGPGAEYKNLREGIVYKKSIQGLWEEYTRDGRDGVTPRSWPSGGGLGENDVKKLIDDSLNNNNSVTVSNQIIDLNNNALILDPRKTLGVYGTIIRGTSAVDITYAKELLVIGTNSTSSTNGVSATIFNNQILYNVLTSGSNLSTSATSIPNISGKYANIMTQTNSTAIAVVLGE